MNRRVATVAAILAWSALTANAAAVKGEDPEHSAKLAQAWSEIGRLPNLWEGTWQEISGLYEFPGPVQYLSLIHI